MDQEIKTQWLDALRSGEYAQATGVLRTWNDGYCCLGVLCDIVDANSWSDDSDTDRYYYKTNDTLPPASILQQVGLSMDTADELANMNDHGQSFYAIADYIEENL